MHLDIKKQYSLSQYTSTLTSGYPSYTATILENELYILMFNVPIKSGHNPSHADPKGGRIIGEQCLELIGNDNTAKHVVQLLVIPAP